jgi:DNA topoisomerase-1
MGVDVKNNFAVHYEISADKKKVITELKKIAKTVDKVWIATDEDREGEAIGRHVAMALGLDIKKTPRIVFHEITKDALQYAVKNPRTININLVDAQQARRVLDRLV